jgi:hypothetical protein
MKSSFDPVPPFQPCFGHLPASDTSDQAAAHQFGTTAGVNPLFHKLAVLASGRFPGFGEQAQDPVVILPRGRLVAHDDAVAGDT